MSIEQTPPACRRLLEHHADSEETSESADSRERERVDEEKEGREDGVRRVMGVKEGGGEGGRGERQRVRADRTRDTVEREEGRTGIVPTPPREGA